MKVPEYAALMNTIYGYTLSFAHFLVRQDVETSSKINNAQRFCLGHEMHTARAYADALFQYLVMPQMFVSVYF